MKARLSGLLAVSAALVLFACLKDPVSDLDGNPVAVVATASALDIDIGTTASFTASVVDGRGIPLTTPVSFAVCDADVSVEVDTSYHPVPATSTRVIVSADALGLSCVVVTGAGFADTVTATVLPLSFAGAASTGSPQVGQPLTLNATTTPPGALLQFDPTASDIDFGNGARGFITSRTATALTVVVPVTGAAQPGPLTVNNIDVTYVPGLRVSLQTSTLFNITNPFDPNDAPDPAATVPIPGTIYEGFAPGAADNFYTFTLGATTTFTVTLDWIAVADPDADLDILFCAAGCPTLIPPFGGATSAKPEVVQATLSAGTYNLYINNFTPTQAAPAYRITVTVP